MSDSKLRIDERQIDDVTVLVLTGEMLLDDGDLAFRRRIHELIERGKLKIRVDQDKCQGHARCKSLAPELFDLDEFGNAHEVGDGTVPAGLEDKAYLAQSNCPEIAIEVTEE